MTSMRQISFVLLTSCVWLVVQPSGCAADPVVGLLAAARPHFIPFHNWHCGAGDFDKHLSHQLAESECPARMYEANLCCLAHDLCYAEEDKSQEDCDSAFCFCLNRTLSLPSSSHSLGCTNVAEGFCDIVQLFGSAAYSSAKSARTTASPATTASSSPADIVQFVTHNISLHCYSHELGACLEELHSCVISQAQLKLVSSNQAITDSVALWPACSQKFCECGSAKPLLGYRPEQSSQCKQSLELVCKQPSLAKPAGSVHVNIQLWTTNVNFLEGNSTITLLLLALISMLTMVALTFLCFKCYKAHRSEGYGISGAAEFVSRARRHTLRKEDIQEPGYKSFQDEKCSPHRLHTHNHLLPMNSSKAQLIAEDSNSSSTPSINSAA